jgi:26S proteasome regulatory subunit N3
MEKILNQNRRSLDVIAAKCYFYYTRVHELNGKLDQIRLLVYFQLNID